MWNKAALNYMYYPVDMTTFLSQCFMWIIESYTGVVATWIKYYAPLIFHWAFDKVVEISPIPLKIEANFFQGYQEWG